MKTYLKFFFLFLFVLAVTNIFSQQIISSSGKYYSNSQGSLSVTVGETVVTTVKNNTINLILTQGFQQPTNQSIVPLQLIEFSGNRINAEVKLQWKVINEINISTYTVQRSADGRTFENIGIITAKNNAAQEGNYVYTDLKAGKNTVYYRLFINEKNGISSISWIVCLTGKTDQIKVYPVPVTKTLTIEVYQIQANNKNIQLVDISGKSVYIKTYALQVGINTLLIDVSNLAAGTYFLTGLSEKSIKIIKE